MSQSQQSDKIGPVNDAALKPDAGMAPIRPLLDGWTKGVDGEGKTLFSHSDGKSFSRSVPPQGVWTTKPLFEKNWAVGDAASGSGSGQSGGAASGSGSGNS
jgi:hypothetical protein